MNHKIIIASLAAGIATLGSSLPAHAQSEATSAASELSATASTHAASAVLALIPAGSELVITLVRPIGGLVEITVESVATGASFVLTVAAVTVEAAALSAGAAIVAVATGAGWLLECGGTVIAFVPDETSQSMTHRHEAQP